jgi:hypothetical protein
MASIIDVANRALTKLGSARITSLADDSKQARSVNSCFYQLLDAELRQNRWSFSIKRASLAALADAPSFGFTYQYALPTDFLRLDMIADVYPSTYLDNYIYSELCDYAIEGNVILTNYASPLKIRYGARIMEPGSWDPLFREALAARIAAEICEDLTQSNEKRNLAWQEYKNALSAAKRVNAIERPSQALPDDQLIISRL